MTTLRAGTTARVHWILITILACVGCAHSGDHGRSSAKTDVVIFAPHPDDDILCCAGVIRRAKLAGRTVHIVMFTNGDGFRRAAAVFVGKDPTALQPEDFLKLARRRQEELLRAWSALDVGSIDVTFLSLPDGVLMDVYESTGNGQLVESPTTRARESYVSLRPDFRAGPRHAPTCYRRDCVLAALGELLHRLRPRDVYLPDDSDQHPDHRAVHRFAMDTVGREQLQFHTYLVHDGPEWPWPKGPMPGARFEFHRLGVDPVPSTAPWPPVERVDLTPDDVVRKLAAIRSHATQLNTSSVGREFLESFDKVEEIFWRPRLAITP